MTHFYTQVHESLISIMINGFGHVTIAHFNFTHYSHVKNGVESPNAYEAIQSDNNKYCWVHFIWLFLSHSSPRVQSITLGDPKWHILSVSIKVQKISLFHHPVPNTSRRQSPRHGFRTSASMRVYFLLIKLKCITKRNIPKLFSCQKVYI